MIETENNNKYKLKVNKMMFNEYKPSYFNSDRLKIISHYLISIFLFIIILILLTFFINNLDNTLKTVISIIFGLLFFVKLFLLNKFFKKNKFQKLLSIIASVNGSLFVLISIYYFFNIGLEFQIYYTILYVFMELIFFKIIYKLFASRFILTIGILLWQSLMLLVVNQLFNLIDLNQEIKLNIMIFSILLITGSTMLLTRIENMIYPKRLSIIKIFDLSVPIIALLIITLTPLVLTYTKLIWQIVLFCILFIILNIAFKLKSIYLSILFAVFLIINLLLVYLDNNNYPLSVIVVSGLLVILCIIQTVIYFRNNKKLEA